MYTFYILIIAVIGSISAYPQQNFPDYDYGFLPQSQASVTPTTAASVQATVVQSRAYIVCFTTCPTTSEYNPVCGSDDQSYNNPQKLQCANSCGRQVNSNWTPITQSRSGTCAAL